MKELEYLKRCVWEDLEVGEVFAKEIYRGIAFEIHIKVNKTRARFIASMYEHGDKPFDMSEDFSVHGWCLVYCKMSKQMQEFWYEKEDA